MSRGPCLAQHDPCEPIPRLIDLRSTRAQTAQPKKASAPREATCTMDAHTHTETHTYIYIYIYLHIHPYIHTYIHYITLHYITYITYSTYIHTYIRTYIHTYMHCIHPYIHTYIHTYIHCIHPYIHTYIHIHIHTDVHETACEGSTFVPRLLGPSQQHEEGEHQGWTSGFRVWGLRRSHARAA